MPRMTSFAAQHYLREHGRCPKGFTANARGRCEERSAWEDKPSFGRVPHRGKGSRRGKRRHAGVIELVLARAEELRTATIRECAPGDKDDRPDSEQRWCLYTADGKKLLGRHPSKESAEKQERAVQVHKHGQSPSELRNAPWDRTVQADMLNKPEAEAVKIKFKEALESAGELCKKIVLNLVEYRNSKPTPHWDQLAETKYILDQLAAVLTFLLDKIENGNMPVPSKDPVTVG